MKTLYLDIFSGISGDMFLAAMLDLGVDLGHLEAELKKLKLDGYHLHVRRLSSSSIRGIKFDVHLDASHGHEHGFKHDHEHHHEHGHEHHGDEHHHQPQAHNQIEHHPADHEHGRNFSDIKVLIEQSKLSAWVKQKALAVFERIAIAEGKVHGVKPAQVHFHEVGAIDSIVDIVGACIALERLGKPRVLAANVVEGRGWVDCAHGRFPVPAAATLEILGARGVAVTQCEETTELVTPTGAAILAEFAESFGPMRDLVAEKIGYGLGTRTLQTRPNCLRAILGQGQPASKANPKSPPSLAHAGLDWETDTVMVLETNLDDINAEILGSLVEKMLTAGALDVFYTSIQMKKNRPGVLLSVLCAEPEMERFAEMILRETTAFGLRFYPAGRRKLLREFVPVVTSFGEVTLKLGRLNGQVVQMAPEYETCRQTAAHAGVPIKTVYEAARQAFSPKTPARNKTSKRPRRA